MNRKLSGRLPNILSGIRILLSLSLLMLLDDKPFFLIVYLCCGLTDFLDGYAARRLNSRTKAGPVLDTIGDLFMFSSVVFAMVTWMGGVSRELLIGILCILGVRVINLLIVVAKYRRPAFLHTWGNKAAGALLFIYPVEHLTLGSSMSLYPLLAVALLSAIEECVINIRCDTLDLDRKGLFFK